MVRKLCTMRTSEVEVDGVAVGLDDAGSRQHRLWVVATKLGKQRTVALACGKLLLLILGLWCVQGAEVCNTVAG